jgi:hypothetical protein
MSLSEVEKQKLITELQQFYVGLVKYKQLVLAQKRVLVKIDYPNLSGQEEEEFNALSLELPRKYGSLKKVIEKYGGPAIILLQGGKTEWEAFSSTFNYKIFDPETFIGVIDKAIITLNMAIGKLKEENSGKTSIYELTSPVYWAERFWHWKPVSSGVGWVKTHRLLSVLITVIMVIAAILTILGYVLEWVR